jgi:hypothetical protein
MLLTSGAAFSLAQTKDTSATLIESQPVFLTEFNHSTPAFTTADLTLGSSTLTSASPASLMFAQPALVSAGTLLEYQPVLSTSSYLSGGTLILSAPISAGSSTISLSNYYPDSSSGAVRISFGSHSISAYNSGIIRPLSPFSLSLITATSYPSFDSHPVIPEPTALLLFTLIAPQLLLRRNRD